MVVIGFTFTANGIYICALNGTIKSPTIQYKDKLSLPLNHSTSELTEWFETELDLILNREKATKVTYRLTISNITNSYVTKVYYGQAILNLLCRKSNIKIDHTSPNSLTYNKFDLPKGADLHAYIDFLLGGPASPWDVKMKDTALMALTLFK